MKLKEHNNNQRRPKTFNGEGVEWAKKITKPCLEITVTKLYIGHYISTLHTHTHTQQNIKNINYYNYFTDRDSNTEWNIQWTFLFV